MPRINPEHFAEHSEPYRKSCTWGRSAFFAAHSRAINGCRYLSTETAVVSVRASVNKWQRERFVGYISGGASAVNELGHLEVRKSSSQVKSPTLSLIHI